MIRDFLEVFLPFFVIASFLFGGMALAFNYWYSYSCGKYEDVTGRQTKWVFLDECYINTGNDWLRKDEYAAVLVAREGLQH